MVPAAWATDGSGNKASASSATGAGNTLLNAGGGIKPASSETNTQMVSALCSVRQRMGLRLKRRGTFMVLLPIVLLQIG